MRATLPDGWEGAVSDGRFRALAHGGREPTVLHAGTFPLPAGRGSFGSGAVELMASGDALVILFEYEPEAATQPLFAASGIPRELRPNMFDRNTLQRAIPGQSGLQSFFNHKGRAFCLYVVLGSHIDRAELIPRVNQVLATLEID